MTLDLKVKMEYFIISFIACNANSSFIFDIGCSYSVKVLLMVCIFNRMLQIIVMTLGSNVKVK